MMIDLFDDPAFGGAPRLIYVHTADHAYTFAKLAARLRDTGVAAFRVNAERLLRSDALPRASYILTDFDRMSPTEVEVTGRIHDALRKAGLPVLNDPRRFRPRHALLRSLHRAGLNRFTCHLPALDEVPDRFPVFLRSIAGHRGVISPLLQTAQDCADAVEEAIAAGYALADLVLIEFAAAPLAGTYVYQKHAAFRIGDAILRANTVNDTQWVAKHGTPGSATDAFYAAELAEMSDYPHAEHLMRAFDLAGVGYGRVDFGIVDGAPQIYEINTNPTTAIRIEHDNPDRLQTLQLLQDNLITHLTNFASHQDGPPVDIADVCDRSLRINGAPRRF